jgi:hypothetical protein
LVIVSSVQRRSAGGPYHPGGYSTPRFVVPRRPEPIFTLEREGDIACVVCFLYSYYLRRGAIQWLS